MEQLGIKEVASRTMKCLIMKRVFTLKKKGREEEAFIHIIIPY